MDSRGRKHLRAALELADRLETLRPTEVFRFLLTLSSSDLEELVDRFDEDAWRKGLAV